MEENLKVDKDYKDAFNLGFELAKELNLKAPMFTDINSENIRLHSMQAGMTEYSHKLRRQNIAEIDKSGDLRSDKGFGQSL